MWRRWNLKAGVCGGSRSRRGGLCRMLKSVEEGHGGGVCVGGRAGQFWGRETSEAVVCGGKKLSRRKTSEIGVCGKGGS